LVDTKFWILGWIEVYLNIKVIIYIVISTFLKYQNMKILLNLVEFSSFLKVQASYHKDKNIDVSLRNEVLASF
jgi:hypothetical protein